MLERDRVLGVGIKKGYEWISMQLNRVKKVENRLVGNINTVHAPIRA